MKIMAKLAMAVGRPSARLALWPICPLFFLFFLRLPVRHRGNILAARSRGGQGRRIYFVITTAFASCVLDRVFLLRKRSVLFDIRLHGEQVIDDLLAKDCGCILLGAHMGSFEALRAAGKGKAKLRIKMAMFEENARKTKAIFDTIDPELAKDVISLGTVGSFLSIQDSLEEGNFIGVLADRSLSGERRVPLPFLGAPAYFSVDAFRMIAILQKPVVLMIGLYRGGNRYDLHFETLVAPGELPRRASPEDLDKVMRSYLARLEHYCRVAPYNWFNFFDIWN